MFKKIIKKKTLDVNALGIHIQSVKTMNFFVENSDMKWVGVHLQMKQFQTQKIRLYLMKMLVLR